MKKIDLNKSDKKELTQIKGVGFKKAENIIEYRNDNGFFNSKEGLLNVKGFGPRNYAKIKDKVEVTEKKQIIFDPQEYNLDPDEINDVHLVGEMNDWDPADKTYSLNKKEDGTWQGEFFLETGTEFKFLYDSNSWEEGNDLGDGEEENLIL